MYIEVSQIYDINNMLTKFRPFFLATFRLQNKLFKYRHNHRTITNTEHDRTQTGTGVLKQSSHI